MKRRRQPPRTPRRPTSQEVRAAHAEHVNTVLDPDNSSIVHDPEYADERTCGGQGYDYLRITYPTPDDLLQIVWEAEDQTEPTIRNDGTPT